MLADRERRLQPPSLLPPLPPQSDREQQRRRRECGRQQLLPASRAIENPVIVMTAMGAASFFGDLTMPCSWGTCMDVGGKFAGTFSGSMNMMGNLGGVLSPWAFNKISATPGGWALAFDVSAGVYMLAGLCWLFIDPVTPLDKNASAPEEKSGALAPKEG